MFYRFLNCFGQESNKKLVRFKFLNKRHNTLKRCFDDMLCWQLFWLPICKVAVVLITCC